MEIIEEARKGNKELRIFQEFETQINPREWDNLGTIAYKHKDYNLGEEEIKDPIDWLEGKLGIEPKEVYNNERLTELEDKFFSEYIAYTIYLYDHSGLRISTSPFSSSWDSGQVGYIYISKEKVKEEGLTEERAKEILRKEIETYDKVMCGEVFGFKLVKLLPVKVKEIKKYEDGEKKVINYEREEEEEINSCWGFVGLDSIDDIYDEVGFDREKHKIEE